ncbi:hypothetical protein ACT8ZV_21835 [Nocardioides sp. MAHUQ-72]|uniref:hypothetical protein n=1 Tax=unclassified Nocardioides TaxID=2615069 RepID=UPI00360D6C46
MRWTKPLLGAVAVAVLLLGTAMVRLTGSTSWDLPTGPPVASPAEVVFATGEELHVGSRTYPIRPAPQTMVSTAGGLYYLAEGVLYRWGRDRSARIADIGGIGWLSTTADGRYLAFVDYEHGPRNAHGSRIAQTVVFDTSTGRELVRDATGNGDRTSTEDLSDLYSESTPTVLGFDDDAVYAQTAKGGAISRWDLDTGKRSDLGDLAYPVTENRPGGPLVDFDLVHGVPRETPGAGVGAYAGRRSPDGSRLAYTLVGRLVVHTAGEREPASIPVGGRQFVLAGWLDADRFYGLGVDEARGTARVLVCSASALRCRPASSPVPAEEGTLPVFTTGDFPY